MRRIKNIYVKQKVYIFFKYEETSRGFCTAERHIFHRVLKEGIWENTM